jgi:hypothetical protein
MTSGNSPTKPSLYILSDCQNSKDSHPSSEGINNDQRQIDNFNSIKTQAITSEKSESTMMNINRNTFNH